MKQFTMADATKEIEGMTDQNVERQYQALKALQSWPFLWEVFGANGLTLVLAKLECKQFRRSYPKVKEG